jgi:alkylresorcinol/alkylpyrone synthase
MGHDAHDDAAASRSCPRLVGLATAVPPYTIPQEVARHRVAPLFERVLGADQRLLQVFDHAEIAQRHACAPPEWFTVDHDFAEKNALYVENAVRLAAEASTRALASARLAPADVDHVVFVSSTGLATPSVDALLANELGFRSDVRRTPVWGLGCAGGAAGLSRARDFARADPDSCVLLVALELCSLTFQFQDRSRRNLVATALFGDGAAAAVVVGAGRAGAPGANGASPGRRPLSLLASRSTLWKGTKDVMGWTVDGSGLGVVFSRDIPAIVRREVRPGLLAFLAGEGLGLGQVAHLAVHPGGVKVLRAYAEALGRPAGDFAHARAVLRDCGNMSSPTCLFVLERFLEAGDIEAGDFAVLSALGPGFSAEYVLLRGEKA